MKMPIEAPLNGPSKDLYEWLVRDCAKVCSDRAKGRKEQAVLDAEAKECARDILARYLLEPK